MNAFIPGPGVLHHRPFKSLHRRSANHSRVYIVPTCKTGKRRSGRGFGTSKKEKKSDDSTSTSQRDLSSPQKGPVIEADASASFVPKGPTLREEYERRGLIEPLVTPESGVLPQIVANRMLGRIAVFGGLPLSFLFAFFGAYFILTYKFDIRVLPVVVGSTTLGTIGLAAMGITYGIFSSSWDEDVEGTKLGFQEFKVNFMRARDGLAGQRKKEVQLEELDRIDKLTEELRLAREREEKEEKEKNRVETEE